MKPEELCMPLEKIDSFMGSAIIGLATLNTVFMPDDFSSNPIKKEITISKYFNTDPKLSYAETASVQRSNIIT